MEIELRLRGGRGVSECINVAGKLVHTFAVGDDGCPHQVPLGEKATALRRQIEGAGLRFRFVTPKIPESHIDAFVATAKQLFAMGDGFSLTANDPGFLHACLKEGCLPKTVTIGRTIARSMQDCPWIAQLMHNPTGISEQIRFQNNMSDTFKIDYFARYNVNSVETNWLPQDASSLTRIRTRGVRVGVHVGSPSVAFARACPTARHFGIEVPNCIDRCVGPIPLQFSDIMTGTDFKNAPLNETKPYAFQLLGNVLYQEKSHHPSSAELHECADYIIVNTWEFKDLSALETFLTEQRKNFGEGENSHG